MDLEKLAALKTQHKDLFAITLLLEEGEQEFIFRPIGREEYRLVLEEYEYHKDLSEFQEALCQFSVVYPADYQFHLGVGGVAELLSDAILDMSGLFEQQGLELLVENRTNMQNFDYQIECIIHEAFPEHSLDEIGSWDMRKTMYYYARAEWILVNLRGIELSLMTVGGEELGGPIDGQPLQEAEPQYQVVKDTGNDFDEVKMVPTGEAYETDPQELIKMKPSELNEHQKQIAEAYTYSMISGEAARKGSKVGKIEKAMHDGPMPELGFYAHEFD